MKKDLSYLVVFGLVFTIFAALFLIDAGRYNAAFGQENEEGNYLPIILSGPESGPTPEPTLEPTPEPTLEPTPKPPDSAGTTILASKSSSGVDANAPAINASLSGDGRYIAFSSGATYLDGDGYYFGSQIYVHDRYTGKTTMISRNSNGVKGNWGSDKPAFSSNGHFIVFDSSATNLVSSDSNSLRDIYVYDMQTSEISLVSVSTGGEQGNGSSFSPEISGDGRFVSFWSEADNLVPNDTNDEDDIFVHDRQTGKTVRVSVASDGAEANDDGFFQGPAPLTYDGRYVAFGSDADNLTANDTNNSTDIFVHDLYTRETRRVSVMANGEQLEYDSMWPAFSADGNFLAFTSRGWNFPNNNAGDLVIVRDMRTGALTNAVVPYDGSLPIGLNWFPVLSGDGRYVAFGSKANNLVPNDTNDWEDVFVYDMQTGTTRIASIATDGTQGNDWSKKPTISNDGRIVGFESRANNLAPGDLDTWNWEDVFIHDFGP